jgi:aspartokinase
MLFTKPANLNGAELQAELANAGIVVDRIVIEANGELNIDIKSKDAKKAETVIAAHNGNTVAPEPTIEQKLASVGLNLGDLKAALGL